MRRLKIKPKGRKKKNIMTVKHPTTGKKLYWDYDAWVAEKKWMEERQGIRGDGILEQMRNTPFYQSPTTEEFMKRLKEEGYSNETGI